MQRSDRAMTATGRHSDARILRMGAITVVVMLLVMAAAFNLSQFPGFKGSTYRAEFKDASGLHKGNMVQVGGIRAGRVQDVALKNSNTVVVTFEVDHGVEFGSDSRASIEVLNLLGEKYLDLQPAGSGQLGEDDVIPTSSACSATSPPRPSASTPTSSSKRSTSSPTPPTRPRPRSSPASAASPGSRRPWRPATSRSRRC
jgi:ABC-type transporter Mla subunit MlaD